MNNIKKLTLFGALIVLATTSCSDDFLVKAPLDQGSVEGFFETREDVVRAINSVYDVYQGTMWGGAFYWQHFMWDNMSDNGASCCPWEQDFGTIARGIHTPTTGGIITTRWDFGYEGIFRANSVLENVDNVDMDQVDRDAIIAEARFHRGMIYAEMSQNYGDLPLVLTVISREEGLEVTRAPKSSVLDAAYADLDYAEANLETTPWNGDIGRPTKQAAIAVKTRFKIYNGDYQGTIAEATKIMNMSAANPGMIGLLDTDDPDNDYYSVFDPYNENNKEVLFDIQFVGGTAGEGNSVNVFIAPGPQGGPGHGWGGVRVNDQLLDAYEMTDGLSIDESPMYNPDDGVLGFSNRDPRMIASNYIPGVSLARGEIYEATQSGFSGFAGVRKWVEEDATIGEDGCSCNETNFIIHRYADVLMYYAEAMNETSGPSQAVYDAVNAIRDRAGQPDLPAGLSQDGMRQKIRQERHVEFAWEGTRYFDLIRWGIAADVIPNVTLFGEPSDFRVFIAPKHNVFPIPQKEIDTNPNLTQNPGY